MTQELCDILGRITSRLVTIIPSLVAIGTVVKEIYWFNLSSDLARPRDSRAMLFLKQVRFRGRHHPVVHIDTVIIET